MFSRQPGLLRRRHVETRPVSNLSECLFPSFDIRSPFVLGSLMSSWFSDLFKLDAMVSISLCLWSFRRASKMD
jgi:hypothetical protein